ALFRHEGDFWTLAYQGAECRVKDAKGLRYIAYLLRHPEHEFHVLDLVATVEGAREADGDRRSATARGETGGERGVGGEQGLPVLDATAKVGYRQRLLELRDELDEAERFNDPGRAERARAEMDAITEQLAAAVGLGGRDRRAGSPSERARSTLT